VTGVSTMTFKDFYAACDSCLCLIERVFVSTLIATSVLGTSVEGLCPLSFKVIVFCKIKCCVIFPNQFLPLSLADLNHAERCS
jgi:hypothetical protein